VPNHVDVLDAVCFEKLKKYKAESYFKKAAMHMLIKISSEAEM